MIKVRTTSIELFLCFLAVGLVGLVGWIWNAIKLIQMIGDPFSGMMFLRGLGLFIAPFGAVLGFF